MPNLVAAVVLLAMGTGVVAVGAVDHNVKADCDDDREWAMERCLADEVEAAEDRLDRVLEAAREHAPLRRAALDESQAAWLRARDVLCEAHMLEDGSIQGLNQLQCKVWLTTQRSFDLCRWAWPYEDNPLSPC